MAIVGIDLGTTNSLVAVMTPEGPQTLANELGDHLTPSSVALAQDGTLLVGRAAKDRLVVDPASGRSFFKRDMGTSTTYAFGGRRWTPTECSAAVLRELKRVAEQRLGEPVESAVVTVPAYFHDPQRQATITAAGIAGLRVERILNEPTAAALAFGYRRAGEERRLLVFDLGGGTFDVTVLEVFEGIVEVRASGGDSRLGGEDYTDVLLEMALARAGATPDEATRARLRQRIEVAKRALSREGEVEVEVNGRAVRLARAAFEVAAASITDRMRPLVRRVLRDADLKAADLDDVLMVGGASRMPLVVQFVQDEMGRLGNRTLDPDRVVAFGAAVQAARSARHEAVRDLVLTDVCPHSLGVEVTKTFSPKHRESGHFVPILDRNVTVPVSRSETFSTILPSQDVIDLMIYQGEGRRVEENTLLGSLRVAGLRSRPGQKHPGGIDVRFSYDANGILEVEVTVLETGRKLTRVIEGRPGALTPSQIEDAIRRLQPLKVRPRDLLPHRARLERAQRLFREVSGEKRAWLTECLDHYEAALEGGGPDDIGFAAARLDEVLAGIYVDEGERGQPADPPSDGDGPGS